MTLVLTRPPERQKRTGSGTLIPERQKRTGTPERQKRTGPPERQKRDHPKEGLYGSFPEFVQGS